MLFGKLISRSTEQSISKLFTKITIFYVPTDLLTYIVYCWERAEKLVEFENYKKSEGLNMLSILLRQSVKLSVLNDRSIVVVLKISMSVTDKLDKSVLICIFLKERHTYIVKFTSTMTSVKNVVRTGGNIL